MSAYSIYVSDNGSGIFRPVAINTPTTLPSGGTRLTIPYVTNLNAGATGNVITAGTTATPIAITTTTAHGLNTGDLVKISGGLVMTAINGTFTFTKTAATTGTLDGSVGSGTYTASSATLVPIDSATAIGTAIQAALRAILNDRAAGN